MPLPRLSSFSVLTCPSLCGPQEVSTPPSVAFFPFLDLFLPLRSPGSVFTSLGYFLSVLTCLSLYGLQSVGTPRSVTFVPFSNLFLPLPSPGSERPSLGHFISMS